MPRALSTLLVILFIAHPARGAVPRADSARARRGGVVTRRAARSRSRNSPTASRPGLQEKFGITLALDFDSIRAFISDNAQEARDLSLRLLSGVKTGGAIVLSLLVNLALIPVVMFYLLRDWNMILDRLDDLLPRRWQAEGAHGRASKSTACWPSSCAASCS